MLNFLRKIISHDNPIRLFWHLLKGILSAIIYGFPGKKMVVIGITGTNGKTTTAHMIEHMLRTAGKNVAMISTSEFVINGERQRNESKKTTLSPFKTQKFLKKCVAKGAEYAVIEASSHALHQYRLWGIPFEISVLTNITHEHLDYHKTMEKYAEAKKTLFHAVRKNHHKGRAKSISAIPHRHAFILNMADNYYESFSKIHYPLNISYGLNQGDLRADNARYSKYGAHFDIHYKEESVHINLPVTGEFNVENALAATGVGIACKISMLKIKNGLESFIGVEGRMERIKSPSGFEVIVDFALTPDALDKLYRVLRETSDGRIIGIIGSCGDRDQKKRPKMGEIVANYCDMTIVTDEEPYSEDPMRIMKAVLDGAKKRRTLDKDLFLIKDRREAMEYAIKNAKKGDMIVLTGMGSFSTRTMNAGPIPWDDREIARELIKKYE